MLLSFYITQQSQIHWIKRKLKILELEISPPEVAHNKLLSPSLHSAIWSHLAPFIKSINIIVQYFITQSMYTQGFK